MMQLKMMGLLITVLALTACASTNEPLVTVVSNPPPAAAMGLPVKPQPPKNGTPSELLRFSTQYGAYCQQLENKVLILTQWGESQSGRLD